MEDPLAKLSFSQCVRAHPVTDKWLIVSFLRGGTRSRLVVRPNVMTQHSGGVCSGCLELKVRGCTVTLPLGLGFRSADTVARLIIAQLTNHSDGFHISGVCQTSVLPFLRWSRSLNASPRTAILRVPSCGRMFLHCARLTDTQQAFSVRPANPFYLLPYFSFQRARSAASRRRSVRHRHNDPGALR